MKIFRLISTAVLILLGSVLLIAAGYALLALLSLLLKTLSEVNATIAVALAASLTAVFGYWYTQRQSKTREIAEAHRSEKVKVYGTFMDIIERFLWPGVEGSGEQINVDNLPEDLQKDFISLNRGLIIWASPNVITTWLKFREGASQPDAEQSVLFLVNDILRAIRKDLGNSNFGLSKGELVKIILRDPEELDKLK